MGFDIGTLEKEVENLKESLKIQVEKAKSAATDEDTVQKAKDDVAELTKSKCFLFER